MPSPISAELLSTLRESIQDADQLTPIQRAVTMNGIYVSSENFAASATNTIVYSNELEEGKITDQKDSGRCWLFATLNILQHDIAKTLKLENFELSQSYSYFWDKLEKSNQFYEQIIATADKPLDDRFVDFMLSAPQYDGGWWEMSTAIIKKYGVVPKHIMPETIATSKSNQLNVLLNKKLRKDALVLRSKVTSQSVDEVQKYKEELLKEVYRFLTITIGTPPQSFDFSYKDKDKKFHRDIGLSPVEFLNKYVSLSIDNYVSIVNDPSHTKEYLQTYTVDDAKNVVGADSFNFLNVDIATFKDLATKQILAEEYIWFGCDIGANATKKGYLGLDVYDFNGTFGIDFSISKAERLLTRDTSMNHAVVISGVDIVDDKPIQWKIENSWGDEYGHKGYYSMSTDWMEQNGYAVVIRKDLLSDELREALKKKPIAVPLWDPLNAVAA
jgi:bleomycin hydrolase